MHLNNQLSFNILNRAMQCLSVCLPPGRISGSLGNANLVGSSVTASFPALDKHIS